MNDFDGKVVLITGGGAGAILPLAAAQREQIADIFNVNVTGPSLLATAALPHPQAASGTIVNVSSTFGHKAAPALSHYAASKAALEHLTRYWALELAPLGVRVNAVTAGPTDTAFLSEWMHLTPAQIEEVKQQERPRIPMARRGVPDNVAVWIVAVAKPGRMDDRVGHPRGRWPQHRLTVRLLARPSPSGDTLVGCLGASVATTAISARQALSVRHSLQRRPSL